MATDEGTGEVTHVFVEGDHTDVPVSDVTLEAEAGFAADASEVAVG